MTALVDNAVDATAPSLGPAARRAFGTDMVAAPTTVEGRVRRPLLAEHGFSMLVEVTRAGRSSTLLFDTGVSPTGVVDNAALLEIDLKQIEAIVLSHGHYDHTTGMSGLIELFGRTSMPVFLHPEAWTVRRVEIPGGTHRELPTPSRGALEGAGFLVVEDRRPSFLFRDSVIITGEIERSVPFETGYPGHEAFREGRWVPDPEIVDDQAVVLHVRDTGLVVLTGCGHAGIVNIVERAMRLTGIDDVLAVVGGFHLGPRHFWPRIPATAAALQALAPRYLVPAHCTGFPAMRALAEAMPDAVVQNLVGTTYTFEAPMP